MNRIVLMLSAVLLIAWHSQGEPSAPGGSATAPESPAQMPPAGPGLAPLKQNIQTAGQLLQTARDQLKALDQLQAERYRERKQQKQSGALAEQEAKAAKASQKEIEALKGQLAKLEAQIADAEEQAKILEAVRGEYEKAKSLRQDAETRTASMVEFRQAAEKIIADLKAKLQEARKRQEAMKKPSRTTEQLRADIEREKEQQAESLKKSEKEAALREAAEKEIQRLQSQLAELEKLSASNTQAQVAAQLREQLAGERKAREASESSLRNAKSARENAEKTAADLKDKVAQSEARVKQAAKPDVPIESLQADLEKEKRLRMESDSALSHHQEARAAVEKEIADWKAKLAQLQAQEQEGQRQVQAVNQLKSDAQQEKKRQEESMAKAEGATAAAEAAEKELLRIKTEWSNVSKLVAENAPRLQAVEQLQAELEQARAQRLEAEAKISPAEKSRETAAQSVADLKRQIANAEKQKAEQEKTTASRSESVRAQLNQEKKLLADAESKAKLQSEARVAVENEIAGLNLKLAEIRKSQAEKSGPDPVISQLQSELEQQRKARESAAARIVSEEQAGAAAEKKLDAVRREWKELEKNSAQTKKQAESIARIQAQLDKEQKLRAEAEAAAGQQTLRREATEKEISGVQAKFGEVEKQESNTQQLIDAADRLNVALEQEAKLKAAAQSNVKRETSATESAEEELKKVRDRWAEAQKQSAEKVSSTEQRLVQLKAEMAKAQQEREDAEAKAQLAFQTRAAAEKEIEQLNSKLAARDKDLANAEEQVRAIAALQAELDKAKQKTKAARDKADMPLDAFQKTVQDLQARLKNAENRYAQKAEQAKTAASLREQLAQEKQLQKSAEADERARDTSKEWKRLESQAADLKDKIAQSEARIKQAAKLDVPIESLQADLEKEKRLRMESDSALSHHQEARAAVEKEIADRKAKLVQLQAQEQEGQRQVQAVNQLKSDAQQEKKRQEESMAKAEGATAAAEAAEKELLRIKTEWSNVSKLVAENAPRLQAVEQLHAELEQARAQRLEAEAKISPAEKSRETVAQSVADLKRQIANAEKQKAEQEKTTASRSESVRAQLNQEKKLLADAESKAKLQSEARVAVENEIAGLNLKLAEIRKSQAEKSGPDPVISQLQSELEQQRKARESAAARIISEEQAGAAAEKKLDAVRREWKELEKNSAQTKKQAESVARIQAQLDKEQKLRAEAEAAAGQQTLRREATEKEISGVQAKFGEVEKQESNAMQLVDAADRLNVALEREGKLKAAAQANVKRETSATESAEEELKKVRDRWTEAQKQSAEKVSSTEQRLVQLKAEMAKAQQEREDAEAKAQLAFQTRAAAEKEIEQLNSKLAAQDKDLANVEEQVRAIAALQAELDKAKQKTKAARDRADLPLDTFQKTVQDLQARLKDAENRYAQKAEQVKTAASLREQLAKEKQLQKSADERARDISKERKRLESQAADISASQRDMEGRIAEIERTLLPTDQLEMEIKKARESYQRATADAPADSNATVRLEVEIASLAKKTESLSDMIGGMNKQLEASRRAQADLARERRDREETEARLKAEISARQEAERQLKTLTEQAADLQTQVNRHEANRKEQAAKAEAKQDDRGRQEAPRASEKARSPDQEDSGAKVQAVTGAGDTNVLAEEQRIIAKARARDTPVNKPEPESAAQDKKDFSSNNIIEADRHYQAGIRKWDNGDIEGAIVEFKRTVDLNPDAAGAYYNLGLAYLRSDDIPTACDYAYQAGHVYAKKHNIQQAMRMVVFMKSIDAQSRLIEKLRNEINKQSK